mmetsp:Transcript_837/g.1305  ORF Transcript_837/g.1305 Transcript_837/m.1305 type:complete len:106 (+) Transcript_837:34-351(+)
MGGRIPYPKDVFTTGAWYRNPKNVGVKTAIVVALVVGSIIPVWNYSEKYTRTYRPARSGSPWEIRNSIYLAKDDPEYFSRQGKEDPEWFVERKKYYEEQKQKYEL